MINKISVFAENGDKSINGLNITTGFPRQQKPFRQWMNYLFNWLSLKTNEVVDEVNKINEDIKPLFEPIHVGELFITTKDYQNSSQVADRHGYGTWVRYAEGRTLVGYSDSDENIDDYRIMGNEFGTNEEVLTLEQTPAHKHSPNDVFNKFTGFYSDLRGGNMEDAGGNTVTGTDDNYPASSNELIISYGLTRTRLQEVSRGGNKPHNNIQPSIVVAYWLRTE